VKNLGFEANKQNLPLGNFISTASLSANLNNNENEQTKRNKTNSRPGLPDFTRHNVPKRGEIYQTATKLA
jgi:hypothetical protein